MKAGGTNAIDTSAPVSSIASATVPKTGSSTSLPSVHVRHRGAGLAGVDAADDLGAGLEHQRGVLGALAAGDALDDDLGVLVQEDRHVLSVPYCVRELGGLVGALVHGVGQGHQRVVGLGAGCGGPPRRCCRRGARPAACWPRRRALQRADDAVGDRVARGDATEDVHEHALDLRVAEDDVQAGGHDLGRRAAADVEEVGGLDAAVVLAGVGDDVERRHDQARTVADDADLAVELDVVEVVLLGLGLERVGGVPVFEVGVARGDGSRRSRRG